MRKAANSKGARTSKRRNAKGKAAPASLPRTMRGASRAPGTFTSKKRDEFLAHYRTGLTVAQAAKKVGTTSVTVFNHVRKDEEFAAAYKAAMETNTDVLEDGLHHLARAGNVAAIFGTLKARRPERWRDRVDLSNQDGSLLKPLADAIKRAHGIGLDTAIVPASAARPNGNGAAAEQ